MEMINNLKNNYILYSLEFIYILILEFFICINNLLNALRNKKKLNYNR
jgi:hypothetical protein